MRSSRCVFSTAAALHRVFVAPIEQSQSYVFRRTIPTSLSATATKPFNPQQRRCYAQPVTTRRLPRDDEIKSWSVLLVNTEGRLDEPRSTRAILESLDREKQSLVVVVPGEAAQDDKPETLPICKIMDKKAMREAEKARSKSTKSPSSVVKTLELNWAIDSNDLGHRLLRMKEFLGKGNKVEINMAKKRKGKAATIEQAELLVKRVREAIASVEGAKESKPMEGKLLEMVTISAEGKATK